jgi:hypothetical protein
MSKSQVRTLISVLCLAVLCSVIVSCKSPTKSDKAKTEVKATAEKPKAAAAPAKTEAKPAAEKPKPAAEPAKPAAGAKGATLGPYALAKNWMDEVGFIDHWLVLGPFPNPGERPDNAGFNIDYLKNYGGELGCTPANGMEVKDPNGNAMKWQQYASSTPEINFFSVEVLKLEPSQEDILVYNACWLEADADKEVELRIGSDDGYKMWLNGKLVGEQNVYRSMEMDSETYKVKLNKGKNLLLVKVAQDWGEFQFQMRVVNAEGKEVPGVKVWN